MLLVLLAPCPQKRTDPLPPLIVEQAGAEDLRQSLAASQATSARLKADLDRAKAGAAKSKEDAGAAAAAAAAAAASESAARARAAVAVGARQDAEKAAAELRERLEERERDVAAAREVGVV